MYFNIGSVIKLLRKHKNFTQEALADNICSIKQLSRIESNKSIPTAFLLKEFSYKLGEEISDYFSYLDQEDPIIAKERIGILEKHALSSDYEMCYMLSVDFIDKKLNEKTFYHKQLLCYKYTASLHINDVIDAKVEDFLDLLKTDFRKPSLDQIFESFINPFDYQILSSIILIYLKNSEYELAKDYLIKIVDSYEKNYIASNDYSYLKALYNLSRIYYKIDSDYEKALYYSSKGLDKCINNKNIYYLDDFCLLKGKSLYYLGKMDEGRELMRTFICLSRLTDNHKKLDSIIVNLKELYDL